MEDTNTQQPEQRVIDLRNTKSRELHFMIGSRLTKPGDNTTITTAFPEKAKPGDKIIVEGITAVVEDIMEERQFCIPDMTFQRLIIRVESNFRFAEQPVKPAA